MTLWKQLASGAALSVLTAAIVQPAMAQVTTSGVRGVVTDVSGAPAPGATVTVTDTRTNVSRTATTGANGSFDLRGLAVGGPYNVSVVASGQQPTRLEGVFLNLGDTADLNLQFTGSANTDVIVVSATTETVGTAAIGPSATFSLEDLQSTPAINRNITDVIRLDPRFYVDESRGDINAIQCGGKNSRFNSLTVDGVRMNDNFGLNSNGYPTERMPFSFDAIEQVAVELAPFDVQYGGFSACNINAVTKSGTNEFHGYAFGDYTNDSLRNDSLEGSPITTGAYDEMRYGVGFSGPIVQDKLFFSVAYEKLEGANLFDRGPIGSGAVNEVNITQAEVDEILAIARDIYGYDPGTLPSSLDNEDEKIFAKLDWNISDRHRASFTYNWNDGFNTVESDSDNSELEFSNHLYERGSELTAYVGSFYSDWTDNFSTEVRLGYSELDARVRSLGGTDFGEMTIETDDVDVYIGGDDSRQSNKLNYETLSLALKGFYTAGDHNISFGYEREDLDVFNLFVQHTQTEIDFTDSSRVDGNEDPIINPATGLPYTAIENFRDGYAGALYYNNAPSNIPSDAAADWGYAVNTVYAQDEYEFGNGLTLIGGLRYDWYTTDDAPETNSDFLADYGFSNNHTLDGEGIIQPRLGFQWDVSPVLDLRGGVGLYSGGNPNVWLSNTYSANNVLQFGQRGRGFGLTSDIISGGNLRNPNFPMQRSLFDPSINYVACEAGVPTGPGYCIPEDLFNAVAGGTGDNFEINYLDPGFKIPSEVKMAFGGTYYVDMPAMGGEYQLNGDILYTISQNSAVWLRGDLEQTGTVTGDDGRVYPTYDSVREAAYVLTNAGVDAKSLLISAGISKDYDNGLNWALGYAYSDAEDVYPMTSSVAFTNYVSRAFGDPQEVRAAMSDYNTSHRFTAVANYEHAFFGDNLTTLSVFGQVNSGRPYSLTTDQDANSISGFNPFLEGNPYLAAGAKRNGEEGSWWGKMDIRLEQEFPGFAGGHKSSAFIVIDNFTNLLNDEWGILREPGFPAVCTVDTAGVPTSPCESRIGDASRYEIRVGLRYEF